MCVCGLLYGCPDWSVKFLLFIAILLGHYGRFVVNFSTATVVLNVVVYAVLS